MKNRGDENGRTDTRFTDLGELQHSSAFHQEDAVDLSRSMYMLSLSLFLSRNNNFEIVFGVC